MTLVITSETMAAAYSYLQTTPPFCGWNLPDADDVRFVVIRSKTDAGWHKIVDGTHVIAASSATIGRTLSLIELMAHEMVHMHQREVGTETPGVMHNKAFHLLGARVCKVHGFDPKLF